MTSSVPAYVAPSPCFAPVSLPATLPQPPILPGQTQCIQQPVPLEQLEELLSQDVVQNSPPEEQSTLAHAVAREMDEVQQADHIREQTWHGQEVEKRRKTITAKMEDGNGEPEAIACRSANLSAAANNIDNYPGKPGSSTGSSSQAA